MKSVFIISEYPNAMFQFGLTQMLMEHFTSVVSISYNDELVKPKRTSIEQVILLYPFQKGTHAIAQSIKKLRYAFNYPIPFVIVNVSAHKINESFRAILRLKNVGILGNESSFENVITAIENIGHAEFVFSASVQDKLHAIRPGLF